MTKNSKNIFKERLLNNESLIGIFASLGSEMASEVLGSSKIDYTLVDMEHAPNDLRDTVNQMQTIKAAGGECLVRIPVLDHIYAKRLLDAGATSIMFPQVNNLKDAQNAVKYVKYPPFGIRGIAGATRANNFGRELDYVSTADDNICVICQIESVEACRNVKDIASTEGVDLLFVGPGDLSADMGFIKNRSATEVKDMAIKVLKEANECNKPCGIMVSNISEAKDMLKVGFSVIAVTTDLVLLRNAVDEVGQLAKK
jgi:2-keto-3-deoxy-L-rhamnonate aldolase RhmA